MEAKDNLNQSVDKTKRLVASKATPDDSGRNSYKKVPHNKKASTYVLPGQTQ